MQIRLNGDLHQFPEPLAVSALLERLDVDWRRVAVEHNRTVLKREQYDSTFVGDGDELEIVNFVGGG